MFGGRKLAWVVCAFFIAKTQNLLHAYCMTKYQKMDSSVFGKSTVGKLLVDRYNELVDELYNMVGRNVGTYRENYQKELIEISIKSMSKLKKYI